jgi:MinD-like ATPase involved in chromosome partitioning or flagellar assembly
MSDPSARGRIITFYSYKGGTGRSMALANVAWILASQGRRVLVIDWDLEAPGLHRYFAPFLEDPELASSPGLIDFVCEFSEAARVAAKTTPATSASSSGDTTSSDPWHAPFLSLLRYTYSLDAQFGEGTVDFVPAGQQGPGYALRVNGFNWQDFYEKLGGGLLLEGLKKRLREDYDFVLIDSRTGISDTSGVCTVQMPDELVVLFTLNQQSIKGAAAVAESVTAQRRRASGEPSLRVWPVATRVELAEKERLDAARQSARSVFQDYLRHMPRKDRERYWGDTEVLYQPYFAYEEVLAVFVEQRRQKASLLASFEALSALLVGPDDTRQGLGEISVDDRARALAPLRRPVAITNAIGKDKAKKTMVVFAREDAEATTRLARALLNRMGSEAIWWEGDEILPGDVWDDVLTQAFDNAGSLLACFGPGWTRRYRPGMFEQQLSLALERKMRIIPVLLDGLPVSTWLQSIERNSRLAPLRRVHTVTVSPDRTDADATLVADALTRLRARDEPSPPIVTDPDDPQKGQWGGKSQDRDRSLSATVRQVSERWFEVVLSVTTPNGAPLRSPVTFHLHPTFKPPVREVVPVDGRATLTLGAWGAFTVGAETDGGQTRLELDLATAAGDFPDAFRQR